MITGLTGWWFQRVPCESHPPSIKHLLNGPNTCKSPTKPSFLGGIWYSGISFFYSIMIPNHQLLLAICFKGSETTNQLKCCNLLIPKATCSLGCTDLTATTGYGSTIYYNSAVDHNAWILGTLFCLQTIPCLVIDDSPRWLAGRVAPGRLNEWAIWSLALLTSFWGHDMLGTWCWDNAAIFGDAEMMCCHILFESVSDLIRFKTL